MKRIICLIMVMLFTSSIAYASDDIWVMTQINDVNGQRSTKVEKKLQRALDKINVIVEENSSFMLTGQVDVTDSVTVDGFKGPETVVKSELTLSLVYTETGSNLGSELFTAKGMGNNVRSAIKKSYDKFEFKSDLLASLFERAKEHYKQKLEEVNAALLEEGQKLYGQNKKNKALIVLSGVDPNTSSYAPSQELIKKIKNEQWNEYKTKLEHEQAMAREKNIQDSLRVDSLSQERMKAEALASAWRDSVEAADKQVEILNDSLAVLEKNEKLDALQIDKYREQVKLAQAESERMRTKKDLIEQELKAKQKEEEEASEVSKISKQWEEEVKEAESGGKLKANVLSYLAGAKIPLELVGKWKSPQYSFTLFADGNFIMTSPHEPERVSGYCTVINEHMMALTATKPQMDESDKKQQLSYEIDSSGSLILSAPTGFKVRFEKT